MHIDKSGGRRVKPDAGDACLNTNQAEVGNGRSHVLCVVTFKPASGDFY